MRTVNSIETHSSKINDLRSNNLNFRMLLSYHYYKNVDLDEMFRKNFDKPYPDVFADSGAFSAYSIGAKIELAEYAEWIHKNKKYIAHYSNLDVKGNVDASLRNQKLLEDNGLKPIPVFHGGEPFDILKDMVIDYRYIALGGMSGHTKGGSPQMFRFLIKCFQIAENKSVFHGFGCTSWKVLKSFKWYSVDSSAWGSGFRYGSVPLFDVNRGCFYKMKLGDKKSCLKHKDLIKKLGFNWIHFADRNRNDRAEICAISALSYMLAEKYLRNLYGDIEIPKLYLADSNPKRFCEIRQGINIYLADTSNGSNHSIAFKGLRLGEKTINE